MKHANRSLTEIIQKTMRSAVTYRVYGMNKELRRPMIHKYAKPTGVTVMHLMAENVTRSNPLLRQLMLKGKML